MRLVPSGALVKEGDLLAEFDTTHQVDAARELEAKVEDLGHEIEQKKAENRAGTAKRRAELREAEAELARAQIQMRKGPLLPEIDRLKAEVGADIARKRIESLKKSHQARARAEAGALRVLELQTDRQKVGLQRAQSNLQRLRVRAPIAGMVALQNTWRSGSMGPPQEGDQLYSGQALLRIFDPASVVVEAQVNQADGSRLKPGAKARVRLDAYPEMEYQAVLEFASPVAVAALDSPIRFFPARFRLITKPVALGGRKPVAMPGCCTTFRQRLRLRPAIHETLDASRDVDREHHDTAGRGGVERPEVQESGSGVDASHGSGTARGVPRNRHLPGRVVLLALGAGNFACQCPRPADRVAGAVGFQSEGRRRGHPFRSQFGPPATGRERSCPAASRGHSGAGHRRNPDHRGAG